MHNCTLTFSLWTQSNHLCGLEPFVYIWYHVLAEAGWLCFQFYYPSVVDLPNTWKLWKKCFSWHCCTWWYGKPYKWVRAKHQWSKSRDGSGVLSITCAHCKANRGRNQRRGFSLSGVLIWVAHYSCIALYKDFDILHLYLSAEVVRKTDVLYTYECI